MVSIKEKLRERMVDILENIRGQPLERQVHPKPVVQGQAHEGRVCPTTRHLTAEAVPLFDPIRDGRGQRASTGSVVDPMTA